MNISHPRDIYEPMCSKLISIKPGLGIFEIEKGSKISYFLFDNSLEEEFVRFILNIGMSYILFQRNYLVIHASSISINGNASLFIGDSGKGKSSLAYAFFEKGYDILTEDFTYIYSNNKNIYTSDSHSLIKLNDKIAKSKNLEKIYTSALDPLKRSIFKIKKSNQPKECKVKNLFFIDWGPKKIKELNSIDVFKYLFRSSVSIYQLKSSH